MKLTTKQIKQMIKEELRTLQENENFENLPKIIKELYKAGWEDEVYSHRQTWEQVAYDALLKNEDQFQKSMEELFEPTAEEYFEHQFGEPVSRIIMNLTYAIWETINDETMKDLLMDNWRHTAEYFKNTEEGREIEEYMRGVIDFAWTVASGELPESPYKSKLTMLAKSSKDGMVQAYGVYESLI